MAGAAKVDNTPIDSELAKAGGFGRFQLFITLVMVFAMQSGGFIAHGIAILELAPKEPGYICTKDGGTPYICSPDDFCDDSSISIEVDYEANNENLYNWYTELRLMCKKTLATSLIAMIAFFGVFVGCMIVPRLGDLFGRKPLFLVSMLV